MPTELYWNTVSPVLKDSLNKLTRSTLFNPFRLVGGTALSLQLGHRISDDVDLFSDADYGSIDFKKIESFLYSNFSYIDSFSDSKVGMGKRYIVGKSKNESVKVDLYYIDKFVWPGITKGYLKMASLEEIAAMKIEIFQKAARKKDFWDVHELLNHFTILQMIDFHKRRYPYGHNKKLILQKLTDFERIENDFNPKCLRGNDWDLIKFDFISLQKKTLVKKKIT
ncbi:MAG: nucleotidyl transferase AbiEii/AbiGii toxin family protein [Bacteroidetes bacterium]|nr:nucleotidyl transferase AbiEii/AbiGii toxin family protein [Bacteroidota bacterium]